MPVVFVIMNDSGLGMVRDLRVKDKPSSVSFVLTDYAKIAAAFGCSGVRVENPEEIGFVLKEALSVREPIVVDIAINQDESILRIQSV